MYTDSSVPYIIRAIAAHDERSGVGEDNETTIKSTSHLNNLIKSYKNNIEFLCESDKSANWQYVWIDDAQWAGDIS